MYVRNQSVAVLVFSVLADTAGYRLPVYMLVYIYIRVHTIYSKVFSVTIEHLP